MFFFTNITRTPQCMMSLLYIQKINQLSVIQLFELITYCGPVLSTHLYGIGVLFDIYFQFCNYYMLYTRHFQNNKITHPAQLKKRKSVSLQCTILSDKRVCLILYCRSLSRKYNKYYTIFKENITMC